MEFRFWKYGKTEFESGGLIESPMPKADEALMAVPLEFRAPRKIDVRDMCLSSSNQYKTPNCAGYTVAGYIEYYNWKTKHYPEQVDGDIIYEAAKQLDRNKKPGTTLLNAARGAMNLHLIKGTPKFVGYPSSDSNLSDAEKKKLSIQFALHEYGVCLSGFSITNEWDYVDKNTGIIRDLGDKAQSKGGHAVLLCGYDSSGVYIQNSWGESWGHYGFGILSWEMLNRQFMQALVIDSI